MPKSFTLGNGNILICLDYFGQVKDFYFPYAGLENHVSEWLTHKIGIFVEDRFSWLDDGSWRVTVKCAKMTMASNIVAANEGLGLELQITDVVYNEENIFIREILCRNTFDRARKVKIFFNQQFNISQTHTGDTAYYDPREEIIVHYKGRRVFVVNASAAGERFSEYCTGLLGIEGKVGTYKDAEDGVLAKNPIEHGQVDSVIALDFEVNPHEATQIYYWITVGKSLEKAKKLNELVVIRHPEDFIETTKDYWTAWVKKQNFSFYGLSEPIIDLFHTSLVNIRTHVSENGAIIASGDSDMFQYGRDTYSYVWPRDAAFSAIALEKAGDFNASRRFFQYCSDIITGEGYFMHKYRPDKALGSSWHPWVRGGQKQFPIQEDETALVLYALWKHYELSHDLEFIESIYNSLIKKAAEFMVGYRDDKTGLPRASYDLWEQDYGIHTFTAATVYSALVSASKFAGLLGKEKGELKYKTTAEEIRKSILKYLYDKDLGFFYKSIDTGGNAPIVNRVIDMSSIYAIYKFGVLAPEDEIVRRAVEVARQRLEVKTKVGGIARYEGDVYHYHGGNIPGNPWVITTMWLAQYYISLAKCENDLAEVRKGLLWVTGLASSSGILPEQFDAFTGEHLSAAPLTWSHAEFVTTVILYLDKLEELGVCKTCQPVK